MIDLHAHILPGVDDGAFDLEEALNMARMSVRSGVYAMVATPHCNLPDDRHPLWADRVLAELDTFQKALSHANIPLSVYPGMEIFGLSDTPLLLRNGKLLTLSRSRYPLIEFPFSGYAEEATAVLDGVLSLGLRPIVAHPERYVYVQEMPKLLNLWIDMGCLLQINRGSLLGRFSQRAEALAHSMVSRGFVTCVASDAHTSTVRTPWMRDVYDLLSREYSEKLAVQLLYDNPRCILEDREIIADEAEWF